MRTETGLQLATRDTHQKVSIEVIPGLPRPLFRLLEQTGDLIRWDLVLHQALLSTTRSGVEYLLANLDDLNALVLYGHISRNDIDNVNHFIGSLLGMADRLNLLRMIMNIDEDVLGAYYFHLSEIHLFWLPIGLIASMMEVSVESLTTVVLAHELAHAYTHLGLDIDGRSWELTDFASSDIRIVEGLAQYYTMVICGNIVDNFAAAQIAFNKLLEYQSPIYTAFKQWSNNNFASGELIRYCMLRTRTQSIRDYGTYLQELEQGMELLKKKKTESTNGRNG